MFLTVIQCRGSSDRWSEADIDYFVDLCGRPLKEVTQADGNKIIEVMQMLAQSSTKLSPFAALLQVRLEAMKFLTGVELLDQPRLQDLVMRELMSLLLDLYKMMRRLFPNLPKNYRQEIVLKGSKQ